MASGRKNYFRHAFSARNDTKLLLLRDEIGVGFYFYYFSLLELCGEESAIDFSPSFEFHHSTIRKLWGVNLKKCRTIGDQMNAVGLLDFKKGEKTFTFMIPNFVKYLGKYTNKIESNVPNKRKEKKNKEKKIKENKPVDPSLLFLSESVIEYLNKKLGGNFSPKTKTTIDKIGARQKEGRTIEEFKAVIDVKCGEWLSNPEMISYLRPETLFGNKFEGYLNQVAITEKSFGSAIKLDKAAIREVICGNKDYSELGKREQQWIQDHNGRIYLGSLSGYELKRILGE